MAINVKTNRIDFRINDYDKQKLERAAELNHLTLASYITSIVLKQADIDLQKNENLLLNEEDVNLIMTLLDTPVEPSENLIGLFK